MDGVNYGVRYKKVAVHSQVFLKYGKFFESGSSARTLTDGVRVNYGVRYNNNNNDVAVHPQMSLKRRNLLESGSPALYCRMELGLIMESDKTTLPFILKAL